MQTTQPRVAPYLNGVAMTPDQPTHPDPHPSELRRQQQEEMSRSSIVTPGQWHGAVGGAVLGAVIGGLLLLAIGLVAFRDGPGVVVLPLIGLGFGAAAGLVYQGGRNPEREHELETATGEPDRSTAIAGNPPEANEH
jgi:hypothetical protein